MRYARFLGNHEVRLGWRPDPQPGAGEVRIRVAFCGACGSDRRLWRGGSAVIPGHEVTGQVEVVGPGVSPEWVNRRVAVYIPRFCGRCPECARGRQQLCQHLAGLIGWQFDGGYASHLLAPVTNLMPIPDDIGTDEAVLALDTLGTTGHGLATALRAVEERDGGALVLGLGPLGAGATLVLQALGVAPVFAFDPDPVRSRLIEGLGAETWVPGGPAPALVVEASGRQEARNQALEVVRPGGCILLLGESDQPWTIQPSVRLRRKDVFVLRTFYFGLGEVAASWAIIRRVRPKLGPFLAVKRPLGELATTLSGFYQGRWLKPLTFPESASD